MIAWIALQVAFGEKGDASSGGAISELSRQPLGTFLLWVMAVGLFALVPWQILEATIGREEAGRDGRLRRRLASAGRAVVYLAFGLLAVGVALGATAAVGDAQETVSSRLMGLPFGRALVGILGAVVIAIGISQIVKGVKQNFSRIWTDRRPGRPPDRHRRLLRQGRRAGHHRRVVHLGGGDLRLGQGRGHGRRLATSATSRSARCSGDHGRGDRRVRRLLRDLGQAGSLLKGAVGSYRVQCAGSSRCTPEVRALQARN